MQSCSSLKPHPPSTKIQHHLTGLPLLWGMASTCRKAHQCRESEIGFMNQKASITKPAIMRDTGSSVFCWRSRTDYLSMSGGTWRVRFWGSINQGKSGTTPEFLHQQKYSTVPLRDDSVSSKWWPHCDGHQTAQLVNRDEL